MPRGRRPSITYPLSDGRTAGASLKLRGDIYAIQFPHPTDAGRYVEKSTGCTSISDAQSEGARIILRHYSPTLPTVAKNITWETALAHLEQTPDLRPDSIRGYRTAVKAFRSIITHTKGPDAVTEELAHRFKREFLRGTFTRGKASDAATYTRTPTSCASYLRSLRSLWKKHFKAAGFVKGNPWAEVPYPNTPRGKRVRLPQEDAVTALLKWLGDKFPDWQTPRLFVQLKLVTGCRTLELCRVKSDALTGDTLSIETKPRTLVSYPLPKSLADQLHAVKGPVYLWERTVDESKLHRHAVKTHGQTAYDPSTWRWTVQNLFREFNEGRAKKDQVRPHDLRARAITLVAAATQSVDATAEALGVDAQTARHYLDAAKAFKGSDILKRAAGVLLPDS